MAGQCVERIERDGHTVQVFLDEESGEYTGYCFSQGKYYPNPYDDKPEGYVPKVKVKTKEEIEEEIEEIFECNTVSLPDRGLRKESLEYFGVKMGVDQSTGEGVSTIYFPYYKEEVLTGYKVKLIDPKNFWTVGSTKDVDFFGWEQAVATGGKKLFITEGEMDAVALYQLMKDKNAGTPYADFNPAIISLISGVSSAKRDLSNKIQQIKEVFKEIIIVFDQDDPGRKAAEEVAKLIPHLTVAQLPVKDANECILKGREKACYGAVMFNAKTPKNTRMVKGSSLREAARKEAKWGLSLPWQGLNDLLRGTRRGETRYWGAGVKMGKSELVNALAVNTILKHDSPILLVKPEEAMAKTYQMLVGKAAGKIFHDPKIEFDYEAFDLAEPLIGDKAIILDSYQFVGWDTLREDIRYAVTAEGVQDVIIDPITALTNQVGVSEGNELLVSMTAELSAMAKDLDFTADIFCHLKAPTQGEPHERGGKVLSTQFAGSRAMMRSCNYMIAMEGNKDPELEEEERNLRQLVILEDREFGNTGIVPLYWDKWTGLFNEVI